jgi:Phosphotransferase enzyme family
MDPSVLPGGHVNQVVRIGATVRRTPPARADFVHDLLGLLEQRGWAGAPRFHGLDEQGREILDYIDGHVPWDRAQTRDTCPDQTLVQVAGLMREFHDLTYGSPLTGPHEVICHNDLSPRNTVYALSQDGPRPVAFIDWDLAAPGERIHDVAHVCWQFLDLGPAVRDVADAARRIRLICDAYGLTDPHKIIATILWWQERCAQGIETAASQGDPAMIRLRENGAADEVRTAHRWITTHRADLEDALLQPNGEVGGEVGGRIQR